jgi:hypothetical protein
VDGLEKGWHLRRGEKRVDVPETYAVLRTTV